MKPTNYIGYHVGHVDDDYDNSSKNKEYDEIIRQVKAGELTIEDAD